MSPRPGTLCFLPGASGDTAFWRPVADGLAHSGLRRFVGYPGMGGVPADPAVTGFADLVGRVAGELGAHPAVLFGQSMGAVIALRVALEKPESVDGLVLSATSGGLDVEALGATDWRPEHRVDHRGIPEWFLEEREDLTGRLGAIRVPVLLLCGDADPYSPLAVGRYLAGLLPRAELVVVAGGGHGLARDRAVEVLPHVERHLVVCGTR